MTAPHPEPKLSGILALPGLILIYGSGTMVSQVLILRELLVLAQGQELKLALGLWCWLLWTGLGSLLGGRLASGASMNRAPLAGLLSLLGVLLPATILLIRGLPWLLSLPPGQSLPASTTLGLFLVLLAPFGLVSGFFFPCACQRMSALSPGQAIGRVYYLETLGAALGILVLQLFLLGQYANLGLSLGMGLILVLGAWGLGAARLSAAAGLLVLGAALFFLAPLENLSRSWQWPGRRVVATVDSPYALLTATREAEQVSFAANNLWYFTYPDPMTAERIVQLALLSHPEPRRVLLLGGGLAGPVPEILKTATVTHLDYVEPDPHLVRLVQDLLPEATANLARDPRVRIIYEDGRRYLTKSPNRYDVIIMLLPEPQNAQLNRYYTREFFQTVARHLNPQGIFSFSLTGAETSLHPLRAAYLALEYRTLGQVFPQVLAFPGERVHFFATVTPGTLVADPERLVARLKERHLRLQYVREYYLLHDLSRPRLEYLRQILRQQAPEINADLNPRCYFYDLVLSGRQEGLPVKEVLLRLQGLPGFLPWMALGGGAAILGLLVRRRSGPRYLYQVLVMGLGTMALEVMVLVLYQIELGYLYRQLGLLIGAFMGGMAAGGALVSRVAGQVRAGARLLAALQGGLALLAVLLAVFLSLEPDLAVTGWEGLTLAGFALVLALAGFGGGGVFTLSAALWTRERGESAAQGGMLYAADLLGATLGTLGISLVVLPVWGILSGLYLVAALHAGAGLILVRK